jgi:hypothetical protein
MREQFEVCGAGGKSARETTECLVAATLDFAGGVREDDMTLLVVRRKGS